MVNFKVIIVGGGPVGLVQAHFLSRAGIDYLLVEKRDNIVSLTGAGLCIWPQTSRLFHQLDLLEETDRISWPLTRWIDTGPDGRFFRESHFLQGLADNHAYPMRAYDRGQLIQLLYEKLPNQNKIKTSKQVTDVENEPNGVAVHFADGTVEYGSIVIGADGVWSTVRQQIASDLQDLPRSSRHETGTVQVDPTPYSASYNATFGRLHPLPAIPLGIFLHHRANHDGLGLQLFTTPTQYFFIAYRPCEETKEPRFYSNDDNEAFIKPFLDESIYDGVKVRDIWEARTDSGLTQVQSGIVRKWYSGRTVLLGDAVHKIPPNDGIGANSGFESAAALTNLLYDLLKSNPSPDTAELEKAFATYQKIRYKRAQMWIDTSKYDMGLLLWQSWINWFQYRFIEGLVVWSRIDEKIIAKLVSSAPQLEFVEKFEPKEGNVSWQRKGKFVQRKSKIFGLEASWWAAASVAIIMVVAWSLYGN